jgi:chemotaxis signal transduction protein
VHGPTRASRLLITEVGGETVALLVDAVYQIATAPREAFMPPPNSAEAREGGAIRAVVQMGQRLLLFPDLERLLLGRGDRWPVIQETPAGSGEDD